MVDYEVGDIVFLADDIDTKGNDNIYKSNAREYGITPDTVFIIKEILRESDCDVFSMLLQQVSEVGDYGRLGWWVKEEAIRLKDPTIKRLSKFDKAKARVENRHVAMKAASRKDLDKTLAELGLVHTSESGFTVSGGRYGFGVRSEAEMQIVYYV